MIRSKIAMGFFWALLALLLLHVVPGVVGPAHAQGTRKDDIVFNSRGIPLAGATVRVCVMPASGQPCTPLALIYSDAALTQALANPTTTDGLGNYFFYAAPGKYEIEISGPGITAKQIPNVILPNDPASPTFSGGISAFSLNLSGNLTVAGNTTVLGNLASGTLNLTNQSTPPGTAGIGTVNLYTKTADKRIYYKDETGTEIGPLGPGNGAQTNVSNTFTATQNIDADFHNKGPNPVYDVTRYGGYLSAAPPSTTGGIAGGTAALTLAAAQDFANGQGIVIYGAGPAATPTTPSGLVVTPQGILNGTTTWNYKVILEDYAGGLTAASAAGTTVVGAATLGVNSVPMTSCARVSGIVTCTTPANHNLQAGVQINIARGVTNNSAFEGAFTLASTPTATTFTFTQYGVANDTATGGSVQVVAKNLVRWRMQPYVNLRSWVYRSLGAGAYSLVGVMQGMDSSFVDWGLAAVPQAPTYVPATPPVGAAPQWLSTTIVSGGGTTALTLANAATTTVAGATTLHDNTPNILAACAAIGASGSGTILIPYTVGKGFTINSTLNMKQGNCSPGITLLLGSPLGLNQTLIPGNSQNFIGLPSAGANVVPFGLGATTLIGGFAYPQVMLIPGTSNSCTFKDLQFQQFRAYQSGIWHDQDPTGNNSTNFLFDNVSSQNGAGNGGMPYKLAGGFGFYYRHGFFGNGAQAWGLPESFIDMADQGLDGGGLPLANQQLAGIMEMDAVSFAGGGILIDGGVATGFNIVGNFKIDFMEQESRWSPAIRIAGGSVTLVGGVELNNIEDADILGGFATPMFDIGTNKVVGLTARHSTCSTGFTPIFQGAGTGIEIINNNAGGCSIIGVPNYTMMTTVGETFSNTALQLAGTGSVFYPAASPAAPTAVVSAGGAVPTSTTAYAISGVDIDGNETLLSPNVIVVVTGGNQTVTVTPPTLPTGTIGYFAYRGVPGNLVRAAIPGSCVSPIPPGTNFVDTFGFVCGSSPPAAANAGLARISSAGLTGQAIRLTGGAAANTLSGTFTAARTATMPDNSGVVPVTGYVNSAYDNATRANGAIGANWTVTNGGINVASNSLQGTAVTNAAFWNVNPFAADEFAEASVTALNAGTDFIGPSVRVSSGGNWYSCVESNASLIFQRNAAGAITNVVTQAVTGAVGDVLRIEVQGSTVKCYQNGALLITQTDTNLTSGSPGMELFGTVATLKNWSGGNVHPLAQLDAEQDWTRTQHFTQGVALGMETFTASPRGVQNTFLPGALTLTWTSSTWTLDKAISVTRVQTQAKTAPSGCTANAVVRLTDGTSPVNLTITTLANDSGPIVQNYAAGASLTVGVQTAAAGCTISPADANVLVQYRMQ